MSNLILQKLLDAYSEIPDLGSVQSKLVLMYKPDALDIVGSYWTSSSFLYRYGYGKLLTVQLII